MVREFESLWQVHGLVSQLTSTPMPRILISKVRVTAHNTAILQLILSKFTSKIYFCLLRWLAFLILAAFSPISTPREGKELDSAAKRSKHLANSALLSNNFQSRLNKTQHLSILSVHIFSQNLIKWDLCYSLSFSVSYVHNPHLLLLVSHQYIYFSYINLP